MRRRLFLALFVLTLLAPVTVEAQVADSASLITRLGADTLAVERFVRGCVSLVCCHLGAIAL